MGYMNKWLLATIAITLISCIYWTSFVLNQFNSLHTYWDLGLYVQSMYYAVHYPSIVHGLQYLSFGNHLSPDQLLILPIYALFQSPQTLLLVQALILCLTGLLVYYIASELLKSEKWGFFISLAYLLNSGVFGVMAFDYHAEFLVIPALLLTFYLYVKQSKWLWPSLALLLGTMEFGPVIAGSFGLAMIIYELRCNKATIWNKQVKIAIAIVIISVIALGLYYLGYQSLLGQYKTGYYPNLPHSLQDWQQLAPSSYGATSSGLAALIPNEHNIYALCLIFLGFGITAIVLIPDVAFILALPYLVEAFIIGNTKFVRIWYYFFAFVIGGSAIAAILSIMVLKQRLAENPKLHSTLRIWAMPVAMTYAIIFFSFFPVQIYSKNINEPSSQFLFAPNQYQSQINQLKFVINQIPSNSSVLAQAFDIDYLIQRQHADLIGDNISFLPQYVLLDYNQNISLNAGNSTAEANTLKYIRTLGNYSLIEKNSSIELFKLN